MSAREPLGPDEIPADTSTAGLVGWIGESLTRSLMLRLAALVSLIGLLGVLAVTAPLLAFHVARR